MSHCVTLKTMAGDVAKSDSKRLRRDSANAPPKEGRAPDCLRLGSSFCAWWNLLAFNLIVDFISNSPNVRHGRPTVSTERTILNPTSKVYGFRLEEICS